jgi:2'-5' RNA ligase
VAAPDDARHGGFSDEVTGDQVDEVVAAVRGQMAKLAPFDLVLGPIRVDPEALLLEAEPAEVVRQLRLAIRAGIAKAWAADRVPEADGPFTPHVSVGYISADGPAEPFTVALDASPATGRATVSEAQLIVISRDARARAQRLAEITAAASPTPAGRSKTPSCRTRSNRTTPPSCGAGGVVGVALGRKMGTSYSATRVRMLHRNTTDAVRPVSISASRSKCS